MIKTRPSLKPIIVSDDDDEDDDSYEIGNENDPSDEFVSDFSEENEGTSRSPLLLLEPRALKKSKN